MTTKKIIAITGATGAQGGGLARAILNDPASGFAVRALTRDVRSEKARALEKAGAEIVAADIDNEESLFRAFDGAYGAFCVTFFWDHLSPQREVDQARNMAQAAKRAGTQHVIWSTLEDTRHLVPVNDTRMPTLMERYKVPHFDGKGEADRLFTDLGLPVTLLLTSFYWENLIYFGMGPKKGADDKLAIAFPMGEKKLPGMAAEDIGKAAHGIFKKGREYIGKTIGIAGEHVTGSQMAAALTEALGQDVRYHDMAPDAYRALGFPGADDLGNMFQFKRDFNEEFCKARSVSFSRGLNPDLQDFATWLTHNAARIPLA
jgi:uncharacterized protein YbjT (DUF2867 family)